MKGRLRLKNLIKSKQRVKEFGEVYTPEHIVKQMCDYCEPTLSDYTKTALEPTCGNGNFLAEILRRKLKNAETAINIKKASLQAVENIYGIDILQDNVEESRERMAQIYQEWAFNNFKPTKKMLNEAFLRIYVNIRQGNMLEGVAVKDWKTGEWKTIPPGNYETLQNKAKKLAKRIDK